MHCHWRDCQAWRELGLPLSTTSNQTCKLYDAALTQYISMHEEESLGGLRDTLMSMLQADPQFVLGHVMANALELMGGSSNPDNKPDFRQRLDHMSQLADQHQQTLTHRETLHVQAVLKYASGDILGACSLWKSILVDHPLDFLALRLARDSYFYLGEKEAEEGLFAWVLPHWTPTTPLYGYLHGFHSFGLVQTKQFAEAEKEAQKGLELNAQDVWSAHSMAHVMEETGRADEGVTFLKATETDWNKCEMFATHNYWHWAVFHIEQAAYDKALDIFDGQVWQRANAVDSIFRLSDACSMLYKLELEGVNVGDRWHDVYEKCSSHLEDQQIPFYDVHHLMACLRSQHTDSVDMLLHSLDTYIQRGNGDYQQASQQVGLPLCRALVAYEQEDYSQAFDIMFPLRDQVVRLGGSDAQRDIFKQILIHAGLNSPKSEHNQHVRMLLTERRGNRNSSPLTDRLLQRFLAQHVDGDPH